MRFKKKLVFLLVQAISGSSLIALNDFGACDKDEFMQMNQMLYSTSELDSFLLRTSSNYYGYVDYIVVSKGGRRVIDQSFANDYRSMSKDKVGVLGSGQNQESHQFNYLYNYYDHNIHPYYRDSGLHTVQSITKSIVSIIIGLALENGHIKDIKDPIHLYLNDYLLDSSNFVLMNATIEDVLTMRLGIMWHEEDRPIDSTNSVIQLERESNWVQFVLNQPMDTLPGTKWVYSSGASQILAQVLKSATKMDIDEYARIHLFEPLGISKYYWKKTPNGLSDTQGGLYLNAQDLIKIGELLLTKGVYHGKEIISDSWIEQSTKAKVNNVYPSTNINYGYGYQWWIIEDDLYTFAAFGFGGQMMVIIPDEEIVIVVQAWNIYGNNYNLILNDLKELVKCL